MKIAVSGLGRMGVQIAQKLAEDGHQTYAHNRTTSKIDELVPYGVKAAYQKQNIVDAFAAEQLVVWIMLPAAIIDAQLDEWLQLIPKGSILIDGGNSDFRLTQKRALRVQESGSTLLDIGTSGGVWGHKNGFSMMAGGDQSAFKVIEPALQTLAKPSGAYQYFDGSGSGHFVKMVHNAIEYGMMESLAEGYRILHEGPYKNIDLAAAGEVWQHGSVITSWLNELCREALQESPTLDDVEGVVAESGEARWTLEVAKDVNLPMPSIQAAFNVRLESQKGQVNFATKLLAAMRNKFGGHQINPR